MQCRVTMASGTSLKTKLHGREGLAQQVLTLVIAATHAPFGSVCIMQASTTHDDQSLTAHRAAMVATSMSASASCARAFGPPKARAGTARLGYYCRPAFPGRC